MNAFAGFFYNVKVGGVICSLRRKAVTIPAEVLILLGGAAIVFIALKSKRNKGISAWEMQGVSQQEWYEKMRAKQKDMARWFDENARCPVCGGGIGNATEGPASDMGDAAMGGRQWTCKKDGATLCVTLMD